MYFCSFATFFFVFPLFRHRGGGGEKAVALPWRRLSLTGSAPSGHPDPRLLLHLLAQAGVGDWRLHGPEGGQLRDGAPGVTELLVDAGVLGHVCWRGVVQDQPQDDDEEGQQVQPWKLRQETRSGTAMKPQDSEPCQVSF